MAVSRLQGKLAKEGREPASAAFKRSRENILPEKVNQVRSPEKSRGCICERNTCLGISKGKILRSYF
ncbi:hypothetical protein ACS0TY_027170 [Phlomoides rotata]